MLRKQCYSRVDLAFDQELYRYNDYYFWNRVNFFNGTNIHSIAVCDSMPIYIALRATATEPVATVQHHLHFALYLFPDFSQFNGLAKHLTEREREREREREKEGENDRERD